jgi:hypothetical protein
MWRSITFTCCINQQSMFFFDICRKKHFVYKYSKYPLHLNDIWCTFRNYFVQCNSFLPSAVRSTFGEELLEFALILQCSVQICKHRLWNKVSIHSINSLYQINTQIRPVDVSVQSHQVSSWYSVMNTHQAWCLLINTTSMMWQMWKSFVCAWILVQV